MTDTDTGDGDTLHPAQGGGDTMAPGQGQGGDALQQSHPALSPLSGAYLLVIVGEPFSDDHKKLILDKIHQGRDTVYLTQLVVL